MKKYGFTAFLLFLSYTTFAQRFLQQNTGTLYDSFENPAQRAFIPDSSRYVAFNFFLPNGGADATIDGNAEATIKSRLLGDNSRWYSQNLRIGQGNFTDLNVRANMYIVMARFFGKVGSNTEYGFSIQARGDGYGRFSDDTFALLDSYRRFPANQSRFEDILNNNYYYQAWSQIGFTYKEDLSKNSGFGFKLSALSGTVYNKMEVNRSSLTIDRTDNHVDISMEGRYTTSFLSGHFANRTLYPRFTNPGAAVTLGGWYKDVSSGVTFQGNIKDLGFISWRQDGATVNEFNRSRRVDSVDKAHAEGRVLVGMFAIAESHPVQRYFTRPIDSRFEGMMSRPFYLLENKSLIYKPTLILSKNFFDKRYNAAILNQLSFGALSGTLSATIDDNNLFAVGGQAMIKSANVELFLGTESLYQSYQGTKAIFGSNGAQRTNFNSYSGASIFLGISAKFGRVIETPPNASYIPMGEKGFVGRLMNRFFRMR